MTSQSRDQIEIEIMIILRYSLTLVPRPPFGPKKWSLIRGGGG
jgi:hypothetical protein